MSGMRVLMMAPGDSIHSKRILQWVLADGCEVVFVDRTDPLPEGHERYRFVPYPQLRGRRHLRRLVGAAAERRLADLAIAAQLRRLSRVVRPDVVHVQPVGRAAYHCALAGIRPLVLTVWGSEVNEHFAGESDAWHRRMVSQALANADLVTVDSPDMPGKCAELAGCRLRVRSLVIGIDTSLFRPGYDEEAQAWRRRLDIPGSTKVFLSPRAFAPKYNQHVILQAFAQALPRFPAQAVLVFKTYGRHSYPESVPYEHDVRRLATELGVSQSLRWMTEVAYAELPALYALADVVINYPTMDAFPVTFLEAAACERPVITVRLPAYVGTFAEHYFHLVDPGDLAALSGAMVEVANAYPARAADGLAEARLLVEREYDQSVSRARLRGIYGEAAALCSR